MLATDRPHYTPYQDNVIVRSAVPQDTRPVEASTTAASGGHRVLALRDRKAMSQVTEKNSTT